LTGTVNEGAGQTSYAAPSDLAPNQTFYWRVTAIDAANGASSPASPVQSFTTSANTRQAQLAAQLGVPLWPGVQPTGSNGFAKMGDNWDVQSRISFDGQRFTSPPLGALEVFDLIDRGMSPQAAIDWMHNNGYVDAGVYYFVGTDVIGFQFIYIARNANGAWDLVFRVGA
jgi:hypothetical protein